MLTVFRLMLLFTLIDPLKTSVSRLMVNMGDAARPIPVRLLQLIILLIGLSVFGPKWGIEGVAIAVNIMVSVGIVILFFQARKYVDFSLGKLFFVPLIGLIGATIVTALIDTTLVDIGWLSLVAKTAVFTIIYATILLLWERNQSIQMMIFLTQFIPGKIGQKMMSIK